MSQSRPQTFAGGVKLGGENARFPFRPLPTLPSPLWVGPRQAGCLDLAWPLTFSSGFHRLTDAGDVFEPFRTHPREGAGWRHGRDPRHGLHAVQDCRQRVVRRRLPDKAVAKRRGCGHQARASRQTLQGTALRVNLSPWSGTRSVVDVA